MRWSLLTVLLTLMLPASAPAAVADEIPPGALHLKRQTLLVADLERSLAIYRDILGFTVARITESSPESYSYPVFNVPAEATLRFATLDSDTEGRQFALTEVRGAALPRPDPDAIRTSTPVIQVRDFDAVLAALRDTGLEIVEPTTARSADGRLFKEMAFIDPDGHLVVLYEFE
ncbi:MAG: VOC family protein [Gammaproteobacteria bacterium]|nr:MAG: VOC family protein [Gammaproteobacteria bacterium]